MNAAATNRNADVSTAPTLKQLCFRRQIIYIFGTLTIVLGLFVGLVTRFLWDLGAWGYVLGYGVFGFLFATIWALLSYRDLRARYHRSLKDRCVKCRYDLTGNTSGTCPECGTMVTIANE